MFEQDSSFRVLKRHSIGTVMLAVRQSSSLLSIDTVFSFCLAATLFGMSWLHIPKTVVNVSCEHSQFMEVLHYLVS